MPGETLNAPIRTPTATAAQNVLPHSLLYSIFARVGGSGLDTDAFETLRASYRGGFLGKAIAYDNRQQEIPASLIHSLRWHPVRLLSFLDSPYYYGAKKRYLDWLTARQLATGRYDLFHSWSGDCLQSLRTARKLGIPSVVEIPTWHRDRGKVQRHQPVASAPSALPVHRQWRGVDVDRFKPGQRPNVFRAIFSGALIERKGIHHLLEAWDRLALKKAELWLVGSVHDEAKPHLKKFWRDNIRVIGFASEPEKYLSQSTIHVFPSQCEGSAKVTYEAAACGLPQITTRESGDVVVDGVEGIIIPPGNVDALAAAIRHLYDHPEIVARMSVTARRRVVENFTWDHFRERLLGAYELAMTMAR